MKYGLGIPLPPAHARRVEQFRLKHAEWAQRPMRSSPHISIKGPAGLSDDRSTVDTLEEIAGATDPFPVRLTEPVMFEAEPILYLGVASEGWWRLHRALVDTIAARTGAEMHPWELSGWIPHATVLRVKPELRGIEDDILAATDREFSPRPRFKAQVLRMYGQEHAAGQWHRIRDFPLGGTRHDAHE
jgi:2'-5' RNA ligase